MTRGNLVPQLAPASQSNGPNRHKNTTALGPDKFPIPSTPFRDHTMIFGGCIPNNFRLSIIFHCAQLDVWLMYLCSVRWELCVRMEVMLCVPHSGVFITPIVALRLNRFITCCALTLGHFSAYNRPSLSFLFLPLFFTGHSTSSHFLGVFIGCLLYHS